MVDLTIIHLAGFKAAAESTFNPLSYWDERKWTINLLEVMSKFDCKNNNF